MAIFVKDSYSFKIRDNPCIDCEALIWDKKNKKSKTKNVYQPPDSEIKACENYFNNIFFKDNIIRKSILLAGDFDINLLLNKMKRF